MSRKYWLRDQEAEQSFQESHGTENTTKIQGLEIVRIPVTMPNFQLGPQKAVPEE